MAITTIFFDLDGTLLPMNQEQFIHAYMKGLCAKAAPQGYVPDTLIKTIWSAIGAVVHNSSQQTNEEVFWQVFTDHYGPDARKDEGLFEEYYHKEFQQIQSACGFQPLARTLIDSLHAKGLTLVLATNPLFPAIATESRIRWAGLTPEDFLLVTTYENSRRCKPSLDYYREILDKLCLNPTQCLMVGNDVREDMIAQQLGMQVFLLTDCLINPDNSPLDSYPHGDFQQLCAYLEQLPGASH